MTRASSPATATRYAQRRVMTVLAYLSPEDGSTGPANFVTGVKRRRRGSVARVRFVPFAGEALGFGALVGGEKIGNPVSSSGSTLTVSPS